MLRTNKLLLLSRNNSLQSLKEFKYLRVTNSVPRKGKLLVKYTNILYSLRNSVRSSKYSLILPYLTTNLEFLKLKNSRSNLLLPITILSNIRSLLETLG